MAKDSPTRSTRFKEDLDDEFEKYRDTNDMSNSEALRSLVRSGMERERQDPLDDRPDTRLAGLLWDARRDIHLFVLIALVATTASLLTTGVVSSGFLIVAAGYALTVVVGAIDAVVFDRGLTLRLAGFDPESDAEVVQ
jgi:Flp pilus assembly protein TadB